MSKGWYGESQKHLLASKGIRSSTKIPAYGEKMNKQFVKMSRDIYSQNKAKIKKLYKEHGLIFDKAQYYKDKFIWENEKERVELVPEDNVVTIYWESKDGSDSELLEQLKEKTKELGGIWKEVKDDSKKKEKDAEDKFNYFEKRSMAILVENERNARSKGFTHCPILKPMIKDYLEVRERKYGKTDKSVDDIVKYVYDYVDEKYPSYKKDGDDWNEGW